MKKQTKLSKLQRWILAHSWANARTEQRPVDGSVGYADIFAQEVMADFFQLPLQWERTDAMTHRYLRQGGKGVFWLADKTARARHNAAYAAVYRTCLRLEARGLVTTVSGRYGGWTGWNLTEEGRQLASNLPTITVMNKQRSAES
jgi:hypothetical protein